MVKLLIRRMACLGGVCLTALSLGGCGVSTLTSSFTGGIFGGGDKPETQAPAQPAALATAQAGAPASPGAQAEAAAAGPECPTVIVAPGEGNVTFSAKGGTGDNLAVMHRGEITETARECAPGISGGLNVKYGFSGRVLLGPQGKPGTVTLPVKITITDASRNTVKAEQVKLPVTIPGGQPVGQFSVVREVLVPAPPGASPRNYRILIGFDRKAPGAS